MTNCEVFKNDLFDFLKTLRENDFEIVAIVPKPRWHWYDSDYFIVTYVKKSDIDKKTIDV